MSLSNIILKKKSDLKFSIITSIYNKRKYLPRLIDSVMKQTFARFEMVLVDCSTDGSYEYLNNISDKRFVVIKQPNLGISVAKNYGVYVSKSKYIAFIDADDFWEHDYLKEINKLIIDYPKERAFVSGYRKILKHGNENVQYDNKKKKGLVDKYFNRRLDGWGVHTSSAVIERKTFYKAGGFPFLLGSKIKQKTWLVDCRGNILSQINFFILGSSLATIDSNYLILHPSLKKIPDLQVDLPGTPAEDQFLHDTVATFTNFVFSSKILSNWDGDVMNQATKTQDKTSITVFPHLFSICKTIETGNTSINKKDLIKYIRYLLTGLIRGCTSLDSVRLKNYLKFHKLEQIGINGRYQLYIDTLKGKLALKFNIFLKSIFG